MSTLSPQPNQVGLALTETSLAQAAQFLAEGDADLAKIYQKLGPPPLWAREPGFGTLLHIILEQQVSLAAALAAYTRLQAAIQPLSPSNFLKLSDNQLKEIGFSRQKTRYSRELAQAILNGQLGLAALAQADDETVRQQLTAIKGIGPWTANIYLLMVLLRPDVWPIGDLALVVAWQKLRNLPKRPSQANLQSYSQNWQPWRAVAARMLWQFYLAHPK